MPFRVKISLEESHESRQSERSPLIHIQGLKVDKFTTIKCHTILPLLQIEWVNLDDSARLKTGRRRRRPVTSQSTRCGLGADKHRARWRVPAHQLHNAHLRITKHTARCQRLEAREAICILQSSSLAQRHFMPNFSVSTKLPNPLSRGA